MACAADDLVFLELGVDGLGDTLLVPALGGLDDALLVAALRVPDDAFLASLFLPSLRVRPRPLAALGDFVLLELLCRLPALTLFVPLVACLVDV